MNTSLPLCSLFVNTTCWRENVEEMNGDYARLMVPVKITMALFMVVGVIGNALVLLVYTFKRTKTSAHILITYLAAIDLFACTVIHPYVIYKIEHFYDQTWETPCKAFEFLVHLNLCASSIALMVVAIDRYLAICKPVKFIQYVSHVEKLIATSLVLAIIISLPLLEFYGPMPRTFDHGMVSLVTYRCDFSQKYQGKPPMMLFSSFVMLLFLIQVVLMSILYKNVAVTAYRARRMVVPLSNAHRLAGLKPTTSSSDQAQDIPVRSFGSQGSKTTASIDVRSSLTNSSPCRKTLNPNKNTRRSNESVFCVEDNRTAPKELPLVRYTTAVDEQSERKLFSSKLKAAKILFLVTAVFFLSWIPFFIMRICHTLYHDYWVLDTDYERILENILNHFYYINNAANPIIYTIINKNFRLECKQVLKKQLRCCR